MPVIDMDAIAKNLVKLRGSKTQEETAKAIGISTSSLAMYETGQRMPRDEIKIAIAQYYKKSVKSIFFDFILTDSEK